jgi:FMN phosphatase YigB (HAD superfamily)
MRMAIDTLLFDLDATLVDQVLPGTTVEFAWHLVRRFRGLAPAKMIVQGGRAAIRAMKRNQTEATNFDVLIGEFCRIAGVPFEAVADRMLAFAERDFPKMAWRFHPVPGALDTIRLAQELGYRLVLATNPAVPLAMTLQRMRRGGVGDVPWAFITHATNMTRLKPQVGYYEELMRYLELTPERCVMIGNDFRKDTPAMALGIRTFIVDRPRFRRQRQAPDAREPDWVGSYADLSQLLRQWAGERQEAGEASAGVP